MLKEKITSPTVIHFYASWCGPCLYEMKMIAQEYEHITSAGFKVICITDDGDAKMEKMKSIMPEGIEFYNIGSLQDINIYTIPTTYFVAGNGEIAKKQVEAFDWSDSEELSSIVSSLK